MAVEKQDSSSLLGNGSEFNGKLTFFGTVRIEGKFDGQVVSKDTLVVAPGAKVSGTIDVGTLIVTGGLVEATVLAREAVEIHPGGRLIGEVTAPVFQIERGAFFEGNSKMPENSAENTDLPESKT
jgi:cytoskeletal protein CcmA (bactofilin family)